MIKTQTFIYTVLLGTILAVPAPATSLDEIYRDIVRSDNSGYLPLYVKNRNAPEFLFDDSELQKAKDNPPLIPIIQEEDSVIDFENKRKLRELEEQARILQWQQTLNAVKENRVTPVELKEIEQKAEKNDPQAIDLPKAFQLYQKAEKLNVPNALQNAAKVYKAMSPKQRKELSPLKAKN